MIELSAHPHRAHGLGLIAAWVLLLALSASTLVGVYTITVTASRAWQGTEDAPTPGGGRPPLVQFPSEHQAVIEVEQSVTGQRVLCTINVDVRDRRASIAC